MREISFSSLVAAVGIVDETHGYIHAGPDKTSASRWLGMGADPHINPAQERNKVWTWQTSCFSAH